MARPSAGATAARTPKLVQPRYRTIVVACDFSPASEAALDLAITMGRGMDAPRIVLAHAFFVPIDLEALSVIGVSPVFDTVATEGRRRLRECASRAEQAGLACEIAAARGEPAAVILDIARSHDADLIFMGTTGRGALPRFFLGRHAERVLRGADCPVIVTHATSHGCA
jgi:nucleotide-binding universal stress UspA family protein